MATRRFSDLDITFTKNPGTNDVFLKYDENAIKGSIKNLILTKHFERPFHSELGTNVSALLFESPSPVVVQIVQTEIRNVIENFEPRVRILDIRVLFSPDNHAMYITITFSIVNTERPITMNFTLNRTR